MINNSLRKCHFHTYLQRFYSFKLDASKMFALPQTQWNFYMQIPSPSKSFPLLSLKKVKCGLLQEHTHELLSA